jgi:hypothetical protein
MFRGQVLIINICQKNDIYMCQLYILVLVKVHANVVVAKDDYYET